MKIFLSVLLLASSLSFGQNVTSVKKGFVVEQDGFFVTKSQMQEFVKTDKENKLLKEKIVSLEMLSTNYLDQISYHKDRANNLQKELDWSEAKGYFKTTGGFLVGVIITGFASYAAIRSTEK